MREEIKKVIEEAQSEGMREDEMDRVTGWFRSPERQTEWLGEVQKALEAGRNHSESVRAAYRKDVLMWKKGRRINEDAARRVQTFIDSYFRCEDRIDSEAEEAELELRQGNTGRQQSEGDLDQWWRRGVTEEYEEWDKSMPKDRHRLVQTVMTEYFRADVNEEAEISQSETGTDTEEEEDGESKRRRQKTCTELRTQRKDDTDEEGDGSAQHGAGCRCPIR